MRGSTPVVLGASNNPSFAPRAIVALSLSLALALALSLSLTLGVASCGFPKTRDCFDIINPKPPAPVAQIPLGAPPPEVAREVELEVFAQGLDRPIAMLQAPTGGDLDRDDRFFIAQQGGVISILRDGVLLPEPFADVSAWVGRNGEEQGLLGMAFHPEFFDNGKVYLVFTAREDGATHVVELTVAELDPNKLDLATRRQILRIGQPWPNNNGGHLAFGPNGRLLVGVGDGGGRGDPRGHAQTCGSWRGKMLRIDVDASEPAVEVIQVGLHNPWRFSFDAQSWDLYVADVGQDRLESIYALPATRVTGHNFGWPVAEGSQCVREPCDRTGFTSPTLEYDHGQGCSVIGGYVYRGRALPKAVRGHYFYADHCSGLLRSLRMEFGRIVESWDWKPSLDPMARLARLTSFAQDADGELYLLSLDGRILKLAPRLADTPESDIELDGEPADNSDDDSGDNGDSGDDDDADE